MSIFKESVTLKTIISSPFDDKVMRIETSSFEILDIKKDPDFKLSLNSKLEITLATSLDTDIPESGIYSGTLPYETLSKYDCIMYGIVYKVTNEHFYISSGGLLSKFNMNTDIKDIIENDMYLYILINKVK